MNKKLISRLLNEHGILIVLAIMFLLFLFFIPNFATTRNMINILKQTAIIGIVSVGLTYAIISGCLDLSVGAVVSLTGVVALTLQKESLLLSFIIPIMIAIVIGYINGFITVKFNINSVIVTLGMLNIVRGVSLMFTGGHVVDGIKESSYRFIGKSTVFGTPIYILVFVVIAVVLGIILWRTSFGRYIYYCGSDLNVCKLFGVKTNRIRIYAFIISSVCAAIAAIILSSRLNTASPVTGDGYEFNAITAIVIGGTSLFGGKGSIFKTVIGIFFIGILINGMILLNIPYAYQGVVKAIIMIMAVLLDIRSRKRLY